MKYTYIYIETYIFYNMWWTIYVLKVKCLIFITIAEEITSSLLKMWLLNEKCDWNNIVRYCKKEKLGERNKNS